MPALLCQDPIRQDSVRPKDLVTYFINDLNLTKYSRQYEQQTSNPYYQASLVRNAHWSIVA
jgi:hypothetical protein